MSMQTLPVSPSSDKELVVLSSTGDLTRESGDSLLVATAVIDAVTGETTGLRDPVSGGTMFKSRAPKDVLDNALPQVPHTAALSTTVGVLFGGGVGKKCRISWLNNGGSAGSLLYIAVNPLNAVEGAMVAGDPKRRDYTLTIDSSVILVNDKNITSVFCIPNGSITSAQHSLNVSFGG